MAAGKPRGGSDPWREINDDVDQADLQPVYFLGGQEPFLARRAYDLLYAAGVAGGPRGFNEQTFVGDKAKGGAVASACNTLPMMGKRRVVVIRQVERMAKAEQDELGAYCANPSPTTMLLLVQSDDPGKLKIDGRTKFPKAIKKNGRWCEFKRLYGRNLAGWIEHEARRLDKQLEPACASYLEGLMGNDLAQIANALAIASLFVGQERRILLDDLAQVVAGRKHDALWDMLDSLGERKLRPTVKALQQLASQGEDAHSMLRLVVKRLRELSRARAASDRGLSARDAAVEAGINPAIAWKFEGQIRAWQLPQLQRAISHLVQAESDMKGGLRIDPRLALESAILQAFASS